MPMKTQSKAEGVDVTIRKPAVEGSGWSAPGCGHFNPRKDRGTHGTEDSIYGTLPIFSQLC